MIHSICSRHPITCVILAVVLISLFAASLAFRHSEPVSEKYAAISWNQQKKIYDAILWIGIIVYLLLFIGLGTVLQPFATIETLLIRGFGTCAMLLLHIVLIIGPLCRLSLLLK